MAAGKSNFKLRSAVRTIMKGTDILTFVLVLPTAVNGTVNTRRRVVFVKRQSPSVFSSHCQNSRKKTKRSEVLYMKSFEAPTKTEIKPRTSSMLTLRSCRIQHQTHRQIGLLTHSRILKTISWTMMQKLCLVSLPRKSISQVITLLQLVKRTQCGRGYDCGLMSRVLSYVNGKVKMCLWSSFQE